MSDSNGGTEKAAPEASQQGEELADDTPQILLPANGRMVIILPLDKMPLPLARGYLLEASDAVKMWYIKQAQARQRIMAPGSTGIGGKIRRLFGRGG